MNDLWHKIYRRLAIFFSHQKKKIKKYRRKCPLNLIGIDINKKTLSRQKKIIFANNMRLCTCRCIWICTLDSPGFSFFLVFWQIWWSPTSLISNRVPAPLTSLFSRHHSGRLFKNAWNWGCMVCCVKGFS